MKRTQPILHIVASCVMEISVEKSELLSDQRVNLSVVKVMCMYIV